MSALYMAEIQGSNGSPSEVWIGYVGLRACTSGRTDWVPLRYVTQCDHDPEPVALFITEQEAREAVLRALWNGQRFRVRTARGNARNLGIIVIAPDVRRDR